MPRGHIYRRTLKDGAPSRWYAVIDTGERGRPRKQVTRSFTTRRDAEAWLASKAAGSQPSQPSGPTLAQWLPEWLAGKAGVKASTRASYRAHVERYLLPMLGGIELARLSRQDVQCWHRLMLDAGIDPATIARIHATLSSALNTARRQSLLTGSPLAGVELPRRRPYRRTVWTAQEASVFLSGARGDAWESLWRLSLLGGLRRGELLGLRWRDLDLNGGTATIEGTRIRLGADILEDTPKSAASKRIVHLDPGTLAVLSALRKESGGQGDGHVFIDRDGKPLDPAAVTRRFHQVRESLGLPSIRLHDLRHTSATLGLASGESLKEVSARLGHSRIAVTADLYTDVTPDLAKASAHRLAASLDRPGRSIADEGAA